MSFATGSLMKINSCAPFAAHGPMPPILSWRRVRPSPSRATCAVVFRVIRLPSASTCTVSVTASAV